MKLKKIPADIKLKSIKEAQNEVMEIINSLEKEDVNLEESKDKYDRMMQLNYYIQEQFKKKLKETKISNLNNIKKTQHKD